MNPAAQRTKFAVAIRDGNDLWLVISIVRDLKGDVYVNWPPDRGDAKWNPHASWHASGQYHNKGYGMKMGGGRQRPRPNASFHGTENLITTTFEVGTVKNINVICKTEDFADIMEVPAAEVIPGIGRMQLSVDSTEPTTLPLIPHSTCPGFVQVRQKAFQQALPWIVGTLFDTNAPCDPHPPEYRRSAICL